MDYLFEHGRISAHGRIGNTAKDLTEVPHLYKAMAERFTVLQKIYAKAIANDGRILGPERLDLTRTCEEVIDLGVLGLYIILDEKLGPTTPTGGIYTYPDQETFFSASRSGAEWALKDGTYLGNDQTIGSGINDIQSSLVKPLLMELRDDVSDGVFSLEEAWLHGPLLIDLCLATLRLYHTIVSCETST